MKVGENGWNWMSVDEIGESQCKSMKVNESGWNWMKVDQSTKWCDSLRDYFFLI